VGARAFRKPGIRFSEHIEADGAKVFAHACKLGLEGIVSKRCDTPYRSAGRRRGSRWRTRKPRLTCACSTRLS